MAKPLPKQHGITALTLDGRLRSLRSKAPKARSVLDRIMLGAGAMLAGATGTRLLEHMSRDLRADMAEDLPLLQRVNTAHLIPTSGTAVAAKK